MNPDLNVKVLNSLINSFLKSLKLQSISLSDEEVKNFKENELFSIYDEIISNEDINWQKFYEFVYNNNIELKQKFESLNILDLTKDFLTSNRIKVEDKVTVAINDKTLQYFDVWLFNEFNKFLADRILLYIKALYLHSNIESDPEEFVRKPILEMYGTLLDLIKDSNEIEDNEKKLRRVIRDAIYESFPEYKPQNIVASGLTESEKIAKYNPQDIQDISEATVEKTVNNLPIDFPFNEYRIGDQLIDPASSLAFDKWMLVSGIVDQNAKVKPEMVFANYGNQVSSQLSNILRFALLKNIYKQNIASNLKKSFHNSPIGLNPIMEDILAGAFSEDIINRVTKGRTDLSPSVFDGVVGFFESLFSNEVEKNNYITYVVNKKLKENKENGGLVDENGMFHKGIGDNLNFNKAVTQTIPLAFSEGALNSHADLSKFNPNAVSLSQYDPFGVDKNGQVGNFVTPSIPRVYEGKTADQAFASSPVKVLPSLSSEVGHSVEGYIPKQEKLNLQKQAFENSSLFRNAAIQNPLSEISPLKNTLNSNPLLNKLPDFEKVAFQSELSKGVKNYERNAYNTSPLSNLNFAANNQIGKAAQALGGATYNPKAPAIANLASTLTKAPLNIIPSKYKDSILADSGKQEAQNYIKNRNLRSYIPLSKQQLHSPTRLTQQRQKNSGFMPASIRGFNNAGAVLRKGSEAAGGSGAHTSLAIALGAAAGGAYSAFQAGMFMIGINFISYIPRIALFPSSFFNQLSVAASNASLERELLKNIINNYHSGLLLGSPDEIVLRDTINRFITKTNSLQLGRKKTDYSLIAANPIFLSLSHGTVLFNRFIQSFNNNNAISAGLAFSEAIFSSSSIALGAARVLFKDKINAGSKSQLENFFNFFLGRKADLLLNVPQKYLTDKYGNVLPGNILNPYYNSNVAAHKLQIDLSNREIFYSKWYEYGKRRNASKNIKKSYREIRKLGYGDFNLFHKGFIVFKYANYGLSALYNPTRFAKNLIKSKIRSVALNAGKRIITDISRKIFSKILIRFGAGIATVVTGGVAGVVIGIVAGTKIFWKFLTIMLVIFIATIVAVALYASSFVGNELSAITTAAFGKGSSIETADQTSSDILLTNNLIAKDKSTGGNYLKNLNYTVTFSYKFNPDRTIKLDFPNGAIYFFTVSDTSNTTNSINRSDFDISTGTGQIDPGKKIVLLDSVPLAQASISEKSYSVYLQFKDAAQPRTASFTQDNPFCTTAVFVKDKTKVDESLEQNLSTLDQASSAITCVDGQGNVIQANQGYVCPFDERINPICTQGSGPGTPDSIRNTLFSHYNSYAMDIDDGRFRPWAVRAPIDGFVNKVYSVYGCGMVLEFKAVDNRRYDFWHVQNIPWAVGSKVSKGQKLAETWQGFANRCWTGQHIHTEVRGDPSTAGPNSSQNTQPAYPEDIYPNLLGCKITTSLDAACTYNLNRFAKNKSTK